MAPPPSPPTSITLKVKVPPGYLEGGSDDFALGSLPVSSTVGALRQHIQQLVPSHPTPERQRLLYGGRALVDNEQTLAEALNTKRDTTQTEYVLHLLVKGDGGSTAPGGPARAASVPGNMPNTSTPGLPAARGALPPQQLQRLEQLQQEQQQQQQAAHLHQHQQAHWQQHQQAVLQQMHQQNMVRQQQMLMQQLQQVQRNGGAGQQVAGMPNVQAGGPMPPPPGVQMLPGGLQVGNPGFGQAIAQGQQQRAAMGMHGIGEHNQVAQPASTQTDHTPTPSTGGQADGTAQGQDQQRPVGQSEQRPQNAPDQPSPSRPLEGEGPNAQPRQPPRMQYQRADGRPVSAQGFHLEGTGPNGQRFHIHQQRVQGLPLGAGMPGQGLPFGLPMMPQLQGLIPPQMPLPGMPPQQPQGQQPQANGPSALDRARESLADMRRMLDEIRDLATTNEEQRVRVTNLQQRVQSVNNYVDPFNLHNANNTTGSGAGGRSTPLNASAPPRQSQPPLSAQRLPSPQPPLSFPPAAMMQSSQPPSNPNDVTCYLLSGPQGPQALLLSPQYGTYTGSLANNSITTARLAPTPTAQPFGQVGGQQPQAGQQALEHLAQHAGGDPVAVAAAQHAADGQARQQAAAQEAAGPLQGVLNHFWLLLRVLIFAYFLLGSNMGWRRPVALLVIGAGFWMVRLGLFGEGGVARRWWDGIMQVGPARRPDAGQQQGQQQQPAQAGQGEDAQQVQNGRQAMPTPEQVAQRLIDRRNEQQNARLQQVRELVRPVERAVALFVASLWPGIGEAHVQAREAEERRVAEEEVAARSREEEERERVEAERVEKEEGAGKEGEGSADAEEKVEGGESSSRTAEKEERGGMQDAATVGLPGS